MNICGICNSINTTGCNCHQSSGTWLGMDGTTFIGPGIVPSVPEAPANPFLDLLILTAEQIDELVKAFENSKEFFNDCGCGAWEECSPCNGVYYVDKAIDILLGPRRKEEKKKKEQERIDAEIKELQKKIAVLESQRAEL